MIPIGVICCSTQSKITSHPFWHVNENFYYINMKLYYYTPLFEIREHGKYGTVLLRWLTKAAKWALYFEGTRFKSCKITTKVVLFFTTFGTGSLCCSWRILKSNVTVWWPLLLIKTLPKTALCMMFCIFSSHELICTSYFDHAVVKAPNNIFL